MQKPRFPLYVPSKGRHEYMMTSRALTTMGVPHHVVVEPDEVEKYQSAIDAMELNCTVLELDMNYKLKYEYCDDLGLTKSSGPGPARNFIWAHAIEQGYSHHWIMDDNIRSFMRLTNMNRIRVSDGTIFAAMEEFTLRFINVMMAGPAYTMFAFGAQRIPPFVTNTRIYSCSLIRNDMPFRWRGRYNEDTILSLDILKAGFCTIQFNAFLQQKMQTQSMSGGNTAELYGGGGEPGKYKHGGTDAKSKMMLSTHPDVARVVHKFGRIHHTINYRRFQKNKLRRRADLDIPTGVDNFGMVLKRRDPAA